MALRSLRRVVTSAVACVMCTALGARADTVPAFVSRWGSLGSGVGQFYDPYGIGVDLQGNVYVADTRNHRVQQFSGDGTFLRMWTGPGRPTTFTPSDVSIDGSGNVFVSDVAAKTIIRLDTALNYIDEWPLAWNGTPIGATQITVDAAGENLYATYAPLVIQYTTGGVFVRSWFTGEEPDHDVNWGVASGAGGALYVVKQRSGPLLNVFTNNGVFLRAWGSFGGASGQFHTPGGVAVSPTERIYVTDSGNKRVHIFTNAGVYEGEWGTAGNGDGQFYSPVDIAIDANGAVYVLDFINCAVQKFAGGITPTVAETWGKLKRRYRDSTPVGQHAP